MLNVEPNVEQALGTRHNEGLENLLWFSNWGGIYKVNYNKGREDLNALPIIWTLIYRIQCIDDKSERLRVTSREKEEITSLIRWHQVEMNRHMRWSSLDILHPKTDRLQFRNSPFLFFYIIFKEIMLEENIYCSLFHYICFL